MTCLIVIQEVMKNKKSFDEYLEFPKIAANIDGTRAGFYEGDSLTI